ncbi:MAG: preprotein translocase subunit SecG [Neisseriaceae bacterium]|nr:preprotein translocase subunit SecG [Neisseriaceae bacterium]
MEAFKTLLWLINIFSALAVIFLVLMQQGKGADAGAAFGSGSAQGVFGASGSASFLSRSTALAAVVFFVTCLFLAYIHAHKVEEGLDFATPTQSVPASNPTENAPQPVIPE